MNEFASNGTYYFKKGSYVKKYFKELLDKKIELNGEYYVSLVYNLMVKDKLRVSIFEIQHMLQWGTPDDLEEYNSWSRYFKNAIDQINKPKPYKNSVRLIPLAGRGSRFANVGYKSPKPLIEVSGKPMIIQAANSLPNCEKNVFVTLNEHLVNYPLEKTLKDEFPKSEIISIDDVTEGQAITCKIGLNNINNKYSLLIAATDNGMIYNHNKFDDLINSDNVDAIIFTFRKHVSSKNNPQMYGWVKVDDNKNALGVSVKVPISKNPFNDHAIVGTFWFRNIEYFNFALDKLLDKNSRVNNEYYVDSLMGELINSGFNVKIFEVEDYICWGTPNDYQTFVYWQSFFHKSLSHPYELRKDITVDKARIEILDKIYRNFKQEFK